MKLSLSILIPCYNVAGSVESVITDAYAVGNKVSRSLEILATDDGSSDQTGKMLERLKKTVPPLRIINHQKNQGYGKTIKELYRAGKREWLFSLPGDGQFNAEELLKLLPATEYADMILGRRIHRNDPPFRLFQSWVYNTLLTVLFGLQLHDVNTIRLMKRAVVQNVNLSSDSPFIDAELAIRAKRAGFTIIEIPVTHQKRLKKGATGGKFFRTVLPTIIDILMFLSART